MTQKEPVSKKEYEDLKNKTKKLRKNLALEIETNTRYRKALEEIEKVIQSRMVALNDDILRLAILVQSGRFYNCLEGIVNDR